MSTLHGSSRCTRTHLTQDHTRAELHQIWEKPQRIRLKNNTWDQDINEWRTLTSGAKLLGEQEEKERMRREVGPEPTLATQEQKAPQARLSPLIFFLFPFLFI